MVKVAIKSEKLTPFGGFFQSWSNLTPCFHLLSTRHLVRDAAVLNNSPKRGGRGVCGFEFCVLRFCASFSIHTPHTINILRLYIVSSLAEHSTFADKIRFHQTSDYTLYCTFRLVLQSLASLSRRKLAGQSVQHIKSFVRSAS